MDNFEYKYLKYKMKYADLEKKKEFIIKKGKPDIKKNQL